MSTAFPSLPAPSEDGDDQDMASHHLDLSSLEAGPHQGEPHEGGLNNRLNWLRAGVLGANDGIVSTAGIVMGVAGATTERSAILIAGVAGFAATGGMIHSIALNAAFAAAHSGNPVTMRTVLDAARSEFRKFDLPVRDRDFA